MQQEMDMGFWTWNARILYRTGEKVLRWDSSGSEPADEYTIFYVNISK